MMELVNNEFKFDVAVTTKIEMKDEAKLELLIREVEQKYKDLVFAETDLKGAKDTRAELNKIKKLIDDERKSVKKSYNKELTVFEDKIKEHIKNINNLIEPIDSQVKKFEDDQKLEILERVKTFILESCENYGLEANEITINNKWLNKSTSEIARQRLITDEMKRLAMERKEMIEREQTIRQYCEAKQVSPVGFLDMASRDYSIPEILQRIDSYIEEEARREEAKLVAQEVVEPVVSEEKEIVEHIERKFEEETKELDRTIETLTISATLEKHEKDDLLTYMISKGLEFVVLS